MPGIEERLDRLESIEEIKQLKAIYCLHCDDDHDGPAIASLFIENGVWESDKFGRFEGRAAINGYFEATKSRISFAAHLLMNPIITVTGPDRAVGKWYFEELKVVTEMFAPHLNGWVEAT